MLCIGVKGVATAQGVSSMVKDELNCSEHVHEAPGSVLV